MRYAVLHALDELKFVDAIIIVNIAFALLRAIPTTLIRLYELLKNDSRTFDRTEKSTLCWTYLFDRRDGGGERDRTDDPLLAKQVLSQLSYTPCFGGSGWIRTNDPRLIKTVL